MILRIKNWFVGDCLASASDFYEKARINLSFNFLFPFAIILFTIGTLFGIYGATHVMVGNLSGAVGCLLHLLLLKKSRNVRLTSQVFAILIFALIGGHVLFARDILHLGMPLWFTILILFTVFTAGFAWGIGLTIASAALFAYYLSFNAKDHYRLALTLPDTVYNTVYVEILIAFSIILYLVSVFTDTSRRAEIELKQSNRDLKVKNEVISQQHEEKIVMMREIHHRVKNNMQVIVSMLRLQSMELKDPHSLRAFEEAQQRIRAMGLIHERMYQSKELSKIEVNGYFRQLASDLVRQNSTIQEIELDVQLNVAHVGYRSLVPIGLILNELVVNSIKHGINEKGKISISGKESPGRVSLVYSDNGSGFAMPVQEGFGFELIRMLTSQLDGEVMISSNPGKGVQAEFSFSLLN